MARHIASPTDVDEFSQLAGDAMSDPANLADVERLMARFEGDRCLSVRRRIAFLARQR